MECDSEPDPESLSTSDTEPVQKEVGVIFIITVTECS